MTLISAWRERTVWAEEERDQARFVARRLWEFIQEGCFLDDLPMVETDSPEGDRWVTGSVVRELVAQSPWIGEEGDPGNPAVPADNLSV